MPGEAHAGHFLFLATVYLLSPREQGKNNAAHNLISRL
jgi:hypothetical protein